MNPIEKDLKNYYGTSSDSDILEHYGTKRIPVAILGVLVIILISTLVTFCLVWKRSRRRECPRMKF